MPFSFCFTSIVPKALILFLERLLIVAYKKFYLRPSYIFKRIKAITSFAELYKKAKAGLRVLIMKKNAF